LIATAAPPDRSNVQQNSIPFTIAVLDDDLDAAEQATEMLRLKGFIATPFNDPAALQASATATRYAAFILDWVLADGTAAALVEWIRRQNGYHRAEVYILSGNLAIAGAPLDPTVTKCIRDHSLKFISKPASISKIAAELRASLGGS